MRFNDEVPIALQISIETTELNDNHIAGDATLDIELEQVAAVRGASEQVDLISDFCGAIMAENTN